MPIKTYNYEGCPIVAPLSINSNQPVFVNDSINLSRTVVSQEAQRWELTFDIVINSGEEDFFVNTLTSFDTVSQMEFPQLNSVNRRVTSTNTLLSGVATRGDSSVSVSNNNGLVPKGSFIKFANHDKVYIVTSDVTANGTLNFFPKLNVDVSSVAVSHAGTGGVTFTFFQSDERMPGLTYEDGVLAAVNGIVLVEAI